MHHRVSVVATLTLALLLAAALAARAQGTKKDVIPHGQSEMPGPPLSPAEAIKKMQVPPGFHVELVAAEPDLVNPVAMTFDEKGRIWITESIEYPRRSAGPGKDRVKVFESTNGDGKYDKITTVIDGLNIPSGIAVGHGGVWVANSPDILFYPFVDRDAPKLGKPEVVVTGFGRDDTHELPNSLTWGPDGYLYGLNGVFNPSVVKQDGKEWRFTCAMFRIHPRTKKFDIFCEGTSNPWGIAFNENGDAFVSACVIDHLWHLTQTGYYHRQGGPYPPYTWKIESIVKHKHQKAAYCGLCWFDSDAYPPEYREKLYMGNIHGNAINCDELTRDGSTYYAKPALAGRASDGKGRVAGVGEGSNFLLANDAWFMPVAQKVGPDGCLYILDWYDRYHCYQDANRDPAGIDRLRGRLYRVVYKDYKAMGTFDLGNETPKNLFERLGGANIYHRETAQRVLAERCLNAPRILPPPESPPYEAFNQPEDLRKVTLDETRPRKQRLHALWSLAASESVHSTFLKQLLAAKDPTFRAFALRMAAKTGGLEWLRQDQDTLMALAKDSSREVQLQVAIAARRLKITAMQLGFISEFDLDAMPILFNVLTHCGDDKLIPHIVWPNLHPLLEKDGDRFLALAAKADLAKSPGLAKVLPRAIDRILGNAKGDPAAVAAFISKLTAKDRFDRTARLCMAALTVKIQNGEMAGKQVEVLKRELMPVLHPIIAHQGQFQLEAAVLGASLRDPEALKALRRQLGATEQPEDIWLTILEALTAAGDSSVLDTVGAGLADPKTGSRPGRARMLAALGRLDDARVAPVVLSSYPKMEPELQPKAIELLTQRPSWGKALLKEIAAKKMSKDVVNVNQARRLLATKDAELVKLVRDHYGSPRDSRNPEREKVVAEMRELIRKTPGDAKAGVAVFKKVCAQCHKIYGEGADVGPDITSNGRSDFEQLLSNVFDPSLVIGAGYQATTVTTLNGKVITGLLTQESKQLVALKAQGGEVYIIPRGDIEELRTSKVSLMPEGLERQLQPHEIADLFAFLCLDRPPGDPKARRIPGTPR